MDVSVGCSTGTSLGYATSGRVAFRRLSTTGRAALADARPTRTGFCLSFLFAPLPPH
jgi:hypothetical protein